MAPDIIESDEIKYWRKRMGITQAQLAVKLGMSTRGVEEWEGGRREPPPFLRLALERIALGLACGSGQPWLADYPIHRDARDLMKLSGKPEGTTNMRAMYFMEYVGESGRGGGAMYLGDGILSGVDAGTAVYDGTYTDDGTRFRANVIMAVPAGILLVTGQVAAIPMNLQLTADWPSDFVGQTQRLMVAGKPVDVIFRKIKALPN